MGGKTKQNWHPWRTQYHAYNDRLNLMSSHSTADTGSQSIVMHGIVYAKAAELFQSEKEILYFCLVFRP